MIEIVPSILSADFAHLADEIARVERGGVSMLHLDVMDGHFVANLTIGPPVVECVRKATRLHLDVHLMIENPGRYVAEFVKAGANSVSVHYEACRHLDGVLGMIRKAGAMAGVVLNPGTPVAVLEDILHVADYVLLMSVNPGFGGQAFIPEAVGKIRELREMRERYNHTFRIEVDGGIGPDNVVQVVRAGAQILVAGTSIFRTPDPAQAVRSMMHQASEALVQRV